MSNVDLIQIAIEERLKIRAAMAVPPHLLKANSESTRLRFEPGKKAQIVFSKGVSK